MSLRTALRALPRRCPNTRSTLASVRRTFSSHSNSESARAGSSFDWRYGAVVAGGAAIAAYALSPTVQLEGPAPGGISYAEVQKHNKPDDCWVIIDGKVYDVTEFIAIHPGGAHIIIANAGKDVTKLFKSIHAPDALQMLPVEKHLGAIDPSTVPAGLDAPTDEEIRIEAERRHMPSTEAMLLLSDFEEWAERVLGSAGWNYYKSAADSEMSMDNNAAAFKRYFFRPRILRDISKGDLETTVVGSKVSMPVFVCPAALAKLGHPLGEVNLTRAAGNHGIIQGISINASCSLDEIMEARQPGQPVWFQIYLNKDRAQSVKLLEKVTNLGAAAIIFTVDVAWQSKRTRDVRAKTVVAPPIPTTPGSAGKGGKTTKDGGVSASISGYQDTQLVWEDIDFIRKHTHLPVIVKGIQSVEDVALCAEKGVDGVILSNHGGRSADYAPAPIDVLYELRALRPDLFEKLDIMLDGGVRSGADAVKALALGAKAVGLGRPFLYANSTHGQQGAERVCEIMEQEITNTMRNCGAARIADLSPELVGPAGPWVGVNRPPWLETPAQGGKK